MPRTARIVLPGTPHHVTHRGNRRADLFLNDSDREVYRIFLRDYFRKAGCRLWAYCWMTNHVHPLVVPCDDPAWVAEVKARSAMPRSSIAAIA